MSDIEIAQRALETLQRARELAPPHVSEAFWVGAIMAALTDAAATGRREGRMEAQEEMGDLLSVAATQTAGP